jgi:hypothetical protein
MAFTTPGTAVAGEVLTAAFLNTNLRDNTNALYDSVRRIAFTQRTTSYNVNATSVAGAGDVFTGGGATGAALTWTADGTSAYRIEFFCPFVDTATNAGAAVSIHLTDGSGNDLGRIAIVGNADGSRNEDAAQFAVYYYTPAAGSRTINVRATRNVAGGLLACGAGGSGSTVPMFLAVFGPALV